MDPELLPTSALIDTGVFLRALGERVNDKDAADCREFVSTMLHLKRDLFVAAPSFAEFLRHKRGTPLPVMTSFVVVPFDDEAARLLGQDFPEDLLLEWARKTHQPVAYYKYDAMIVACAARWKAGCVVALDRGMRELAKQRNLRAELPGAFRARQGQLALVPMPAAGAEPQSAVSKDKSLS